MFLFLCCASVSRLSAQDITQGLLGYYSFCDCSAKDNSGNGRDGSITGSPACIRGKLDYGLLLNQQAGGSNGCGQPGGQYIRLPQTGSIWQDGFTVCAWVRFDEIKNYERIIDFSNNTGEAGGMPLLFGREGNSNTLILESWTSADGNQARSVGRLAAVNAITNGSIEFYCATISGNTMSIYVNGALVAQKTGNPVANVPRINNYIGHSAWCGNDPDFKGFMDEVRIYTRALSGDEIRNLYTLTNVSDFLFSPVCNTRAADFSITQTGKIDSIAWNFGDAASAGANTASGFAASHVFTDTGTYTVRAVAYKFCLNDTVIKPVHIGPYTGFLGNDIALCQNQPRTLQPGISGSSYQWQDGSQSNVYMVSQAGLYWVNVVKDGCTYRDSIMVTSSNIRSEINETICQGKQYAGYTKEGTYTDVLTAANGCDSTRVLNLAVLPSSASSFAYTMCPGATYMGYATAGFFVDTLRAANGCDSVRTVQITLLANWKSSRNVSICEGSSYMGHTTPGTYSDSFMAANGCDSIETIVLSVRGKPRPQLAADTTVCAGDAVLLSPGSFDSYLWQDGRKDSTYKASGPGVYKVTVSNGCDTATAAIQINTDRCDYLFPGAFTPDHDGRNDVFRLVDAYGIRQFSLQVFTRWGQKIFETRDYAKGWNGSVNGQPAAAGVYVWKAFISTQSGRQVLRQGTVVLLR